MKRHPLIRAGACAAAIVVAACAETTAPLPPPEEVLLVVNSTEASLSIVPTDNPNAGTTVPLGGTTPTPVSVAALNDIALVPMGLDNSVVVVDLRTRQVLRTIGLPSGSGATGAAIIDDSIAYVANPNLNTVTRVNYQTGDTASVAVGVYPDGVVFTRGRVFVLNANLVQFAPAGPSWITVIDPLTNLPATGIDSIGLPGPGNAGFAAVGADGLLYVVSSGDFFSGEGRLSIVDPVGRQEVGNFGGFGTGPGSLAADAGERLFISSFAEGLMEFNTRTRAVVIGAGNGVAVPGNSSVAVDGQGRIYAISTGPCQGGQGGVAHVLRSDLTESRTIGLGECAIYATVVSIPPGS
ncbi:MAG: YncE family protein [Gemmatimonadales bacterium]